ncbi:hypothetical protein ACFTWF_44315 [Rhodococcus sp. NPDC056960]|uniref:hypothetical protein n=1 Tax=Rhodococcus sp. NPDC056960 TaxID=3345982 RepID=UPI00362657FE
MATKRPSEVRAHLARAAEGRPQREQVQESERVAEQAAEQAAPAKPAKKIQQGITWDPELLAVARSAVAQLGMFHPEAETPSLAALVDRAVRAELDRLETEYNDGQPFQRLPKGARLPRTR